MALSRLSNPTYKNIKLILESGQDKAKQEPENNSKTVPIADPISNLGLEILRCLKIFPGLNTLQIVERISHENSLITRDKVKNELKRY